ncbi:unnamed protein product [Microthlaspi erraticum]|uniref:F-box associated beta-propeller type 1 domain-containing protein n=1 Tax=Microthlaspi erraticum TaxID=1685480 RepID=A0A6D2L5L7_9BRAS|nr:unnamed protein product [Microthlaspi erraticum]
MTSRLCDLPYDLIGENILAKVPLASLKPVRSTCKLLNALSKDLIVGKAMCEFLGFMTMMRDGKLYTLRIDLQGIRKDEDLVHSTIKQFALPDQVEIYKVIHSEGLVLCVINDTSRLLVWNPYLGQTRWIEKKKHMYMSYIYVLGYDNNRNHKILRLLIDLSSGLAVGFEIYDFSSDSWRVLDLTPDFEIEYYQRGETLKGNAYFFAKVSEYAPENELGYKMLLSLEDFLVCFDFTRERFGKRLPLPFNSYAKETVTLSCVREEKLAVLYEKPHPSLILEIWVTNKIEPDAVSWSKFLVVDMSPLTGFQFDCEAGCFFIDEEKKVAVVFDLDRDEPTCRTQTAYIIGEDGYYKSVKLQEAADVRMPRNRNVSHALVSSCYLPSLVQWESSCFFMDEEKKVAVVFDRPTKTSCGYQIAYIIGEDGYFKSVKLEEDARMPTKCNVFPARLSSSGYLPCLVQI